MINQSFVSDSSYIFIYYQISFGGVSGALIPGGFILGAIIPQGNDSRGIDPTEHSSHRALIPLALITRGIDP